MIGEQIYSLLQIKQRNVHMKHTLFLQLTEMKMLQEKDVNKNFADLDQSRQRDEITFQLPIKVINVS